MSILRKSLFLVRLLGVAATLAFLISAFTPLWNVLGAHLAVAPDLGPADAIVVLGSGVTANGELMDESMRRAMYGMQLYKRGLSPLLVVSGPARQDSNVPSEAEIRKGLAVDLGISTDHILTISNVLTTQEEARQVAAALSKRHAGTILLVTESAHIRRSTMVFRKEGLNVRPAPSDDQPHGARSPEERLYLMYRVLEQTGALVYYKLAGYI